MSKEISKVDQRELHLLAREINESEEAIRGLRGKTEEAARITVAEAILQGQRLSKVKEMLPHGMWLPWLKVHCPLVKERQARNYIRIADPENGTGADSIKGALLVLSERADSAKGAPAKITPGHIQTIYLLNNVIKHVRKHPVETYPEATKDELRKELHPIASNLWPDKFPL